MERSGILSWIWESYLWWIAFYELFILSFRVLILWFGKIWNTKLNLGIIFVVNCFLWVVYSMVQSFWFLDLERSGTLRWSWDYSLNCVKTHERIWESYLWWIAFYELFFLWFRIFNLERSGTLRWSWDWWWWPGRVFSLSSWWPAPSTARTSPIHT